MQNRVQIVQICLCKIASAKQSAPNKSELDTLSLQCATSDLLRQKERLNKAVTICSFLSYRSRKAKRAKQIRIGYIISAMRYI